MTQLKLAVALLATTLLSVSAFAESPKWSQEQVRTAPHIPNSAPNREKVASVIRNFANFSSVVGFEINLALNCAAESSDARDFDGLANRLLETDTPARLAKRLSAIKMTTGNQSPEMVQAAFEAQVRRVANEFFRVQILMSTFESRAISKCYTDVLGQYVP